VAAAMAEAIFDRVGVYKRWKAPPLANGTDSSTRLDVPLGRRTQTAPNA